MGQPMQVKICGITRGDQGRAIAQLGAHALGFICVPESPRYVTPEQIRDMVAVLPPAAAVSQAVAGLCDRVGVFVNASPEQILATVTTANLNVVQLHGGESPEFCYQLATRLPTGTEIIKALRIRQPADLAQAQNYEDWVDRLLLDAYHPAAFGGTGLTLDWAQLQTFRPACPWFLAGGLTPDNVQAALALVHPDGIDLSSGVERSPGDKDLAKVKALFAVLQSLQ
jgi:phosphoribosylanthranilate isomerase